MRNTTRKTALVLAVAIGCTACAAGVPEDGPAPGDTAGKNEPAPSTDPDGKKSSKLTIVGFPTLKLDQGKRAALAVRYTTGGKAVVKGRVRFHFSGDPKDALLGDSEVVTDARGMARTQLTAGKLTGKLQVQARATGASAATWYVTVRDASGSTKTTPPKVNKLFGTFALQSIFSINGKFRGNGLATALNAIDELTDDPDDPGRFVADAMFGQISNPLIAAAAALAKVAITQAINGALRQSAPKLVTDAKQLGADLRALARRFQVSSQMISATAQKVSSRMSVDHKLKALAWTLRGKRGTYGFLQLGQREPVRRGVSASFGGGQLALARHEFDIPFGTFLLAAFNGLAVPAINANAKSIGGLLKGWINCSSVGQSIQNAIQTGGTSFWKATCDAALRVAALQLDAKVAAISKDRATLDIAGRCALSDKNSDSYYDLMTKGQWSGLYKLGAQTAVIAAQTNSFTGKRVK